MLLNSEEEYIRRLRSRDETVIPEIYGLYAESLYAVLYRLVHSESIAEELLKDVFVRMWEEAPSYDRSSGRLYTWMLSIARKLAIDKLKSVELKVYSEGEANYVLRDLRQPPESEQNTPEIKEVKSRLRPEQKDLIDVAYFYGFSQADASKRLKIPLGTVKNRLRSAVAELRKILDAS